MPRSPRLLWTLAALLALGSSAFGQITWTHQFQEPTGVGFNDTGTLGTLRRASLDAATTYLNTILDARGSAQLRWIEPTAGSTSLASMQTQGYIGILGSFQGGGVYQRGRTGANHAAGPDGIGRVNYTYNWHYDVAGTSTTLNNSTFDFISVITHEIGHSLGFTGFSPSDGIGGTGQALGSPDLYTTWDRGFQRGNTSGSGQMFRTNINNSNFGSYNTAIPTSTYNSGNQQGWVGQEYLVTNNATSGLFFGGSFAEEVYGRPVPLYAPTNPASGSSGSHVNVGATAGGNGVGQGAFGLMNFSIGQNTIRRFQPYEIAMLMDMGWNVYNWSGTSDGSWGDANTSLANSRWTTNSGIVRNAANNVTYNTHSFRAEAPILPLSGQTTANIALNFRSDGASYTSTNGLGSVRLSRMNFSGAAGSTITIAGGTLNFGENLGGLPSVLVPKIVQNGNGAVVISSAIQTNNIATQDQVVSGRVVAVFQGHSGVTFEGTGTGSVTLSGNISGTGGLTKNSAFTLVLSGTNSYTGTTVVNGGTVLVNGNSSAATGAVTVNGGTLAGTGTVGGAVTVNSGGILEGGNTTAVGTLSVANNVTLSGGGVLRAQLGTGTSSDQINLSSGSYFLNMQNGAVVTLVNGGFAPGAGVTTYTLADLIGTDPTLLRLNGANVAADTTITTFTSTGGNGGNNVNNAGQVNLSLSGFTLAAGDRFALRRSSGGDLVLVFTPVPEPAGLVVLCGAFTAAGLAWRRWRRRTA